MRERAKLLSIASHCGAPEQATIRIAQYSGYPRVSKDQRMRSAVAVKGASTALCLIAVEPEEVGALLRLKVTDLAGPPARETLARVVSCNERRDDRFELGLETVEPHAPRFVRREPGVMRVEG